MRFAADRVPAPPVFPDAYRVRAYDDVGDPALLARAMTAAYSGLWGHHDVSAEDLVVRQANYGQLPSPVARRLNCQDGA